MSHDHDDHPPNPRHMFDAARACEGMRVHVLPCRRPLPTRRAQQARALSPRARYSSPTATLSDRISASTRTSLQYRGHLD
jgi:hypothetical protein